jgi:hypothetical protein
MAEVLVLAPSSFGADAQAFVEAALGELRLVADADGMVVSDGADVARATARLRPGSVVLGSISSDLAIEVAGACRRHGLLHVEVGALSDRILGPGTLRLTAGVGATAAAVQQLIARRPFLVVSEQSDFAAAVLGELIRFGSYSARSIEEVISKGFDTILAETRAEVVVAVLRPPWPERLVASLDGFSELIGVGSWSRSEVGQEARKSGVRVRFCDVMPASLLPVGELAPEVAASLLSHLAHSRSVYGDLGWAGGLFLRDYLGAGPAERLASLDLKWTETGFGHGIRFDTEGRNQRAGKAILEWVEGEMRLVARPSAKEIREC